MVNHKKWVFHETSDLTTVKLLYHFLDIPGDSWEWPKYVSYQSENRRKWARTDKLVDVLWLSEVSEKLFR